jgi:hypothetical protein
MNTKTIFYLLFFIILSSFCFAESTLFYKVNSEVDLKIPCVKSDNSKCTASAICNITVSYPNNTIYVNNKAMTNNNVYFNYTLDNANTSGEYPTVIYCIDGTEYGYSFFSFKLNQSGDGEQPSGFLTVIILIPLLFAFVFMIGSISLGQDHTALKIFLFLLSILSYFSSAYFGIINLIKFYVFPEMNEALSYTTIAIGFVFLFVLCYFLIYIIQKAIHAMAQNKKEKMEY